MTLETCKLMLECAKARGDDAAVAEYEARIQRKLKHPKYANVKAETKEVNNGKKSE